jgi:hypothetical protein
MESTTVTLGSPVKLAFADEFVLGDRRFISRPDRREWTS